THGVQIKAYHADNGIFTSQQFKQHLEGQFQDLSLSGVGAHHQNGVAERAIKTVVASARTMMLHATLRWPEEADETLWPLALGYSAYLWNITPKPNCGGHSPLALFSSVLSEHPMWSPVLHNTHVWGCPSYVLDPTLQDGKKLPKWQPRSRQGMFVGVSPEHASTIGDILNLRTKSITPQFHHVVYDDDFTTVSSTAENVPPNWDDLIIHHGDRVLEPTAESPPLADEWLDEEDLALRRAQREEIRPRRFQHVQKEPPASQPTLQFPEGAPIIATVGATDLRSVFDAEPMDQPPTTQPIEDLPAPIPSPPSPPKRRVHFSEATLSQHRLGIGDSLFRSPQPLISTRSGRISRPPQRLSPVPSKKSYPSESYFTTRCSLAEAFVAMEDILTDPDSNQLDGFHPMAFASKPTREDNPLYHEAMA
ncbi:MAG: hypothetical protein ACREOZ_04345, partial [Gloeomargaritales cyanobacterium]